MEIFQQLPHGQRCIVTIWLGFDHLWQQQSAVPTCDTHADCQVVRQAACLKPGRALLKPLLPDFVERSISALLAYGVADAAIECLTISHVSQTLSDTLLSIRA